VLGLAALVAAAAATIAATLTLHTLEISHFTLRPAGRRTTLWAVARVGSGYWFGLAARFFVSKKTLFFVPARLSAPRPGPRGTSRARRRLRSISTAF